MDIHDFAMWASCIFVDVVDKGRKQRFVVTQMFSRWGCAGLFFPFTKTSNELRKSDEWIGAVG